MVAISLFFASLLAFTRARPTFRSTVIHEKRHTAPAGFSVVGPAPTDATIKLRIGLSPNNISGLEDALLAVSTPSSPLYGQYLTQDQVKSFVAPSNETISAVTSWLASNNLTATTSSPAGDWITVQIPISQANELLEANYQTFTHTASGKQSFRTLSYALPVNLAQHIDAIHPTTSFNNPVPDSRPVISAHRSKAKTTTNPSVSANAVPASCAKTITPACVQALYGVPTTPATQSNNTLGVSGFIDQFAQTSDLQSFLSKLRTDVSSTTSFSLQTLDGGSDPQGKREAGVEANLDIQYTVGIATGVPVTFISVGENTQDGSLGGFLDIINALLAEDNPPQVLTTSYGDNESAISSKVANKLCNAYMQLGALGTSILFASGDGGVAGSQSQSCTTFQPTFPAGCPYLTAVGATQGVPETAASFSSGGFSNIFAQPSFQADAVSTYLTALGKTNSGKFNTAGRGFPDVSAIGVNVEIVSGGAAQTVDGTSCSSPIFASMISLINDQLMAAGKPVLGFLNPWLYANPTAFNDITTGNNPGCGTNGFPAKTGWDPVTGLGSPDFAKLLTAAGL